MISEKEIQRRKKISETAKRVGVGKWMKGRKSSPASNKKRSVALKGKRSGKNNPAWKGGRTMILGYVYIYSPTHPYRTQLGYVKEHRLVMESLIHRYLLPNEIVHHLNKNRSDNRPENLQLLASHSEHAKIHRKNKYLTF